MITIIRNYNTTDIKDSINYLLDKASKSEEVRQLAVQITYNKEDKIGAIYDFMKSSVSYIQDPVSDGEIELFVSPVKQVENYNQGLRMAGDCDDMALLATALYRSIGIKSNVVIIDSLGNGLDHAYCRAWSKELDDWIECDPTSQYPLGWSVPYHSKNVVE